MVNVLRKPVVVFFVSVVLFVFLLILVSVPFTLLDVLLTPASILLILLGLKSLIGGKKLSKKDVINDDLSTVQCCYYIFFSLLTFILGIWCVVSGWESLLLLFSGIKGSAHGYTVLSLGLLIAGYSLFCAYQYILVIRAVKN